MDNKSVSLGTSKIITINDKPVQIKKLGLIKYVQMTKNLKSLISSLLDFLRKVVSNDELLDLDDKIPVEERSKYVSSLLTELLEQNLIEVISFIDLCVDDLDFDYIAENVGLSDTIEIIQAIVEVNKLYEFGDQLKNLLRGLQTNQENSQK